MKKKILISISCILLLLVAVCLFYKNNVNQLVTTKQLTAREQYSLFLKEHPFNNHTKSESEILSEEEEEEGENKADRPDLAWEQDFLRTMDPALKRPAPERLPAIIAQMRNVTMGKTAPGNLTAPWQERGPNNIGGRTRAIVYDPSDLTQKKVWAGGVTGGLWYNNDITNVDSTWRTVNDFWDNIAISCIAFDPNNLLIAYVGTGESYTAGGGGMRSGGRGAGIWKTTNGGSTWAQITSTAVFYYINDIVVRNESGTSVIYAAVDAGSYGGVWSGLTATGLQRSINGGSTWTQVLPVVPSTTNNFVASDIEISANNRIWIGTKANPFSSTDRGGGRILTSLNGTTWTISNTTTVTNGKGRVELACAPSDSNYVYAIVENNNAVSELKKTINNGSTWTSITKPVDADSGIPSTDFSRGQAWYDLTMAVDPNNSSIVIVGAIDLFRTTNAGSSWSQISKWSNNNNLSGLSCSMVHADQHSIVYKPGSSSTVLFGNDGGIFYTSSVSTAATNNVIADRNKNYNVTQFYACAQHPNSGSNVFLAGAQDNGTQRFTTAGVNATNDVYGGDGAFCFIDQTNGNYQIVSYVFNTYSLSTNGGSSFGTSLSNDQNTGRFINPSDYDNNLHILYSCRGTGTLNRIKNITTTPTSAQTVTLTGMTDYASHICVSPYTTTSSTLFVGTEAGSLYKVTTADGTPTTTNITGSSFPTGSISCVEIGASESELLVTFFNYGVTSVWYTANGGTSWVSKEGNLPDMPIRWALFNPLNRSEVILATELGVWASTNFTNTTPTWSASNSGLANVRVDMLQIRSSDKMVIAATHGRGLFSSNAFSLTCIVPTTQVNNIIFSNIYATQMDVSWTSGNGSRRVVYMNTSNTFTAPLNGTEATANSLYSGSGAQLIYNGTNSSTTVTGLSANTTYYFRIYEANCNGTNSFYQTSTATNNPNNQATSTTILPVKRINEKFSSLLTPVGWTLTNTSNLLSWNSTINGYNATQNIGCVKADNFNVVTGAVGVLETRSFYPTIIGDSLKFDITAAGYGTPYLDSLSIFAYNGSTYNRIRSWITSGVVDTGITTLGTTTEYLSTLASHWRTKSISLPVGTTKVQFRWRSGYGNGIYVDNIVVDSFVTPAPLNGTYTVGTSGAYVTITAAVNDLNTRGVSGPVTFNLINNNYSTNETFPIIINNFVGSSITNKLTIKPTLANTVITGNNGVAIIQLNGSKNVIIDGAISGITRNLSVINTNSTTSNSSSILIASLGIGLGANNDTIRNLITNCGTTAINTFGVVVSGADNQNIICNNLKIEKALVGFYSSGIAGNPANNIRFTNSSIGSNDPANYISYSGVYMAYTNNSLVNKDSIYNILTLNGNAPSLYLGPGCTNITVSNNVIDSNRYIGTLGYGSKGIYISTGNAASNINIQNNFISRIGGDGWSGYFTDNIIGIGVDTNSGGINIYNNTVKLSEIVSGYSTATNSFALFVGPGATSLNIKNNIFYNSIVNTNLGATGAKAYAFASQSAATAFTNLNYNNYYVAGTQAMLAYFGGADKSNLAALKTATTQDLNSVNLNVFFAATGNLHLTGTSIGNFNLKCLPVSGITTDIDNENRNISWHYMGADENTTYPLPIKLNSFVGYLKNNDVELNWSTAFEFNNDYFIVEKSIDNVHFEAIGKIKGKGNSNIVSNYNFTDFDAIKNSLNNGILFYRLNQFDFDGQNAKSDVIVVKVSANGNNQLEVFPNPFENNLNLVINSSINTNAQIEIIDVQGKMVYQNTIRLTQGFNSYSMNDLSALPNGTYIIQVNNNENIQTIKINKVK